MSDDLFVREKSQPRGMMGTGIEVDDPDIIRVALNTGVKCDPPQLASCEGGQCRRP